MNTPRQPVFTAVWLVQALAERAQKELIVSPPGPRPKPGPSSGTVPDRAARSKGRGRRGVALRISQP
jgi:hypothetical protein